MVRPRQVHGIRVAVPQDGCAEPDEADAIVSTERSHPVGIVTADCVPVLAASRNGEAVAAIHAGWRGLAAGVVGGLTAAQGLTVGTLVRVAAAVAVVVATAKAAQPLAVKTPGTVGTVAWEGSESGRRKCCY